MRLLEIIIRRLKITPFIALASSYTLANNQCTGENLTTPDIIKCSQETFERVDKLINEQYLALINTQANEQRKAIVQSQISWIKFKENTALMYMTVSILDKKPQLIEYHA